MSQPSVQLRNRASIATGAGNATVFGPPYLEAREQEPPFVPRTCSPSLLGLLAKMKCSICSYRVGVGGLRAFSIIRSG